MSENNKEQPGEDTVRDGIIIDGKIYPLKRLRDSIGNASILDISGSYQKNGVMTLDIGGSSTANCQSSITYIDGEKGVLLYRGYPIEQIAEKGTYIETVYLLLYGELPNSEQLQAFERKIISRMAIDDRMLNILTLYPKSTHPMALLKIMVNSLNAFHRNVDASTPQEHDELAITLIAKMPMIVASVHRHIEGLPFIKPRPDLNYTENFLHMCFADEKGCFEQNKVLTKAMDKILILHADHEQNASTTTVRQVGSTGADLYAAVSAGIGALGGPAHGGANEAVLKMLKQIGTPENVPAFIKRVTVDKEVLLMGFGHRVYKTFDPRAKIIKRDCHEVLSELAVKDNLFAVAKELENTALKDPYFTEHKLYPNVDFYSGIILSALGFSSKMHTPLFALARTSGWTSQWKEMVEGEKVTISRPRQNYIGAKQRDFLDIETRSILNELPLPPKPTAQSAKTAPKSPQP